jgi:hypothetical protein
MGTDTIVPTERPSEHAVVVPVKQLMDEELERRIELVRERDNVGRGEAFETATEWLQSQINTDLLADIERGLYRIWYSRSKHGGDFQEVAIWFEGTLYDWPSTGDWLRNLLQERLDGQCRSIGTFFRSNELDEREALEIEAKSFHQEEAGTHEHNESEVAEQGGMQGGTGRAQHVE